MSKKLAFPLISWDCSSNLKCVFICTDINQMPLIPCEGFQMQGQVALFPHEPQLCAGKCKRFSPPGMTHTLSKALTWTPQLSCTILLPLCQT